MPLNWNINKIEDWENYCFEPDPENPKQEKMTTLTRVMLHMTMPVGMHEITKKNYREFYTRMLLLELDTSWYKRDEDGNQVGIQLEDVKTTYWIRDERFVDKTK